MGVREVKRARNKVLVFVLAFSIFIFNQPLVSHAEDKAYRKVKISHGIEAEEKFYTGDYDEAVFIFEALSQKKDRNYALWNNQLGSIYLTKGEHEKALDAFLKAHYLINDIEAFSKLETMAISLIGSEANKAYKGDPYEKVFNSLYAGLLLYRDGDLENALAAFKNGILCDSDVQADLYQSDVFMLYLLASRIALIQGNDLLSNEYFDKANDAYCLTHPENRTLVSIEQGQHFLLVEKEKEIEKLKKPKSKSKKRLKEIEKLETEIGKIDSDIKISENRRKKNNTNINVSALKDFIDLKNNTLLCIELGKGPLRYPIGQYGQLAIFTCKPCGIKKIKVFINEKPFGSDKVSLSSDVFFQAITRGGREMDGILKGQAQFKQTTADMSMACSQTALDIMNQANLQSSTNPYYDPTSAYMAGAAIAVIGLGLAMASAAANPAADVRHWSLMPGNIIIAPFYLAPGTHNVKIERYDNTDRLLDNLSSEIDVEISEKNNIIFKRLL